MAKIPKGTILKDVNVMKTETPATAVTMEVLHKKSRKLNSEESTGHAIQQQ
jgi:hypothetical protein